MRNAPAADKIGLTQPALSKRVRRREAEFGAALFSTVDIAPTFIDAAGLKIPRP